MNRLPLVTLYLSERCNSRCVSCDYWRHGRDDMNLAAVQRLLPDLARLRTELVLLSGGEPLLNPEWAAIAETLRANGIEVWLLTSGLSLAKHARRATELCQHITVSLDGVDAPTYAAIRGLNAFEQVCAGIRAVADHGLPAGVRVTVQRANYRQMPGLVELARQLRAGSVSFLAADVANPHAFARGDGAIADLALEADELPEFKDVLRRMERDHGGDFASGFIAESPEKLMRLHDYFAAVRGLGAYPRVRCNAPEFSAVISAKGTVNPCFFIPGSPQARVATNGELAAQALPEVLNRNDMAELRASIRSGSRSECKACVCSLWREPAQAGAAGAWA